MLTVSVSTASVERSFSKLKLIKTYLRSTMSQERLSALSVLSIEAELVASVSYDIILKKCKNVSEFLKGIDNQIKLLEIPSDLSCAYLKGHLLGRALDFYQIFGSALVQNTATDFTQLKAALTKAFPAIQNRKDLEVRFYASQQRRNQEPTDFVYHLLKLNKKIELGMSEKALVDHIFVILEPQVQDYVEVRNPQNTVQLLESYLSLRKDIHARQ
ncbi:uncharacterized protein TNCV_2813131 [Trichonephila clavipes]|nr:uncharacterized protein TNCV_2813131 [Trichonephila clavipes]